jgi:hypothetical protein
MQTSTQIWDKKERRKENLGIKLLHIRSPINMCFLTFVVGNVFGSGLFATLP